MNPLVLLFSLNIELNISETAYFLTTTFQMSLGCSLFKKVRNIERNKSLKIESLGILKNISRELCPRVLYSR